MNYNLNSGYGLAESLRLHLNLPVMGKVHFVIPTADANYNRINDIYHGGTDPDGSPRIHTTLALAYTEMALVNNAHDVMALSANAGHAVATAGLVITRNRMHIVGMDGGNRRFGSRSRVTGAATVTEVGIVHNTGVGNTFRNLKFDSASTVAASIYAVAEGGEYSYYKNCEFYKSTDLDQTGAAELLMNGDSCRFENCTFGSLVNAISGAILRPCVLLTRETITGKACRDSEFIDCLFWRKCGDTGNRFIYGANANDVERMLLFERCIFVNAKLGTAVPAQNVAFGATQTEGEVLLKDCSSMNAATAMSTTTGVFVDSPVPTAGTSGISVQAT